MTQVLKWFFICETYFDTTLPFATLFFASRASALFILSVLLFASVTRLFAIDAFQLFFELDMA